GPLRQGRGRPPSQGRHRGLHLRVGAQAVPPGGRMITATSAPVWAPDISKDDPGQADGWRPRILPPEVWDARPVLRHIRQAAHARARSADLVLGGTLARLAAMIPHQLKADTGVGSPAPLNLFVAGIGPSGAGKSSAAWIPRD